MSENQQYPNCLRNSRPERCKFRTIVPVRFALTSEKKPPLSSSGISGKDELIHLENYNYTLRTIQQGYVFITWDGLDDEDILVYEAHGQNFIERSDYGYGTTQQYINIPDNAEITEVYMAYVRIPDMQSAEWQEVTRKYGTDEVIIWKKVAANLLKNDKKLMQKVRLAEGAYSALHDEIFNLVEECKSIAYTGSRLDYLSTWPKSRKFLNSPEGGSSAEQRWIASCDPGYELPREMISGKGGQITNEVRWIPNDAILVALHDPIGQVYDCVSIYGISFNGICNYEGLHSLMHISAYFSECALKAWENNLKDKIEKNFVHDFKYNPSQLSPEEQDEIIAKVTREDICLPSSLLPQQEEIHRENIQKVNEENLRQQLDYLNDPTKHPDYIKLLSYQDTEALEKYRNEYKDALQTFTKDTHMVLADWFTLLGAARNKKFSLSWTLHEIFAADRETQSHDEFADPITHARDYIFASAHKNLSNYSMHGDGGNLEQCNHYDFIYAKLIKGSGYLDLFEHITQVGGVPHQNNYLSLMQDLGAFLAYANQPSDKIRSNIIKEMLEGFGKRIGGDELKREYPTPLAILDACLLGGDMAQDIDETSFDALLTYSDFSSMTNAVPWFYNIFENMHKLTWDEQSKQIINSIQEARQKLSELIGKPSTVAIKAQRMEMVKTIRIELNNLTEHLNFPANPHNRIMWNNIELWKLSPGQDFNPIRKDNAQKAHSIQPTQNMRNFISSASYALVALQALCNTFWYALEVYKAEKRNDRSEAIKNAAHMLPYALASVEVALSGIFKKNLIRRLGPVAIGAGAISDMISTVDLVMNRDIDAALGKGIATVSSAALAWGMFKLAIVPIAVISWPVTAFLAVVTLLGTIISNVCKDSDIEKYLKTKLWSDCGKESRDSIMKSCVDCFKLYKENKTWQAQLIEVKNYLAKFFPVSIKLFTKEQYVYIGILIPFAGNGKTNLMLKFCKGAGNQVVNLVPENDKDLFLAVIEEQVNGQYRLDMCLDLEKLFAKHQPILYHHIGGGISSMPTWLDVTIDYCLNDDIEYTTATDRISLSNYQLVPGEIVITHNQNDDYAESRLNILLEKARTSAELTAVADY